jgi:hypothetical protein
MFYNQIMTNTFIYQQLCFTKTMRPLLAQRVNKTYNKKLVSKGKVKITGRFYEKCLNI